MNRSVVSTGRDFRFRPPLGDLTESLAAALDLAFGPVVDTFSLPQGVSGPEVFDAARSVFLTSRIAARWPNETMTALCGQQTAADFKAEYWETAAAEIRAEPVIEEIALAVAELEIPVVFLKGVALLLGGHVVSGSRDFNDVDVLAPSDKVQELQSRLIQGGFWDPGLPSQEHHLGVLAHSTGPSVEVHFCLRGVRSVSGASLTLNDAEEMELVRPVPHLQGRCLIPQRDLLLAHILVHGIAQHGLSPQGYPLLKVLADSMDLGLTQSEADGRDGEWFPLIEQDVSQREVQALARLGDRFARGERSSSMWIEESDEALLLRHFALGNLDDGYVKSLKLRYMASVLPTGRSRWRTHLRTAWRTLLPSRAVIDRYYGKPKGKFGYLNYRLQRPFVLILRTFRYSRAAWAKRKGAPVASNTRD